MIAIIFLFIALRAFSSEPEEKGRMPIEALKEETLDKHNLIEARAAYFFFTNTDAREIYHNGTIDLELEHNYWFTSRYSVWTNLNFIWQSGKSQTLSTPTWINITTLSLGAKEFFSIWKETIKLYLGLGITGAYVRTKDQTNHLPQKTIRWSPGCVGKFGFLFHYKPRVFVDLFFDYYYQPTPTRKGRSFTDSVIDLGGFRTGAGIGYSF